MGVFNWVMFRKALEKEGFDEITVENIEEIVKDCHEEVVF